MVAYFPPTADLGYEIDPFDEGGGAPAGILGPGPVLVAPERGARPFMADVAQEPAPFVDAPPYFFTMPP